MTWFRGIIIYGSIVSVTLTWPRKNNWLDCHISGITTSGSSLFRIPSRPSVRVTPHPPIALTRSPMWARTAARISTCKTLEADRARRTRSSKLVRNFNLSLNHNRQTASCIVCIRFSPIHMQPGFHCDQRHFASLRHHGECQMRNVRFLQ